MEPNKRYGKRNHKWTGVGDLPGTLIAQNKANARLRKRDYTIPNEYLWELWLKQDGKCALTGVELVIPPSNTHSVSEEMRQRFASLDRIDSKRCYEIGNVQWVCKTANLMKRDLSDADFVKFCKLVVSHSEGI